MTGILGSRTDNHRHGFCGCAERSRRSWQIDQKRRLFSFSPIPHGWRPSVEPASARRRCAAIRPSAAESVRLRWVATSHHLPATSRCIRAPTLRPDPGTTPAATARQPSFPLIAARHGVANRILRTVSAIRESSGDPFTSLLRSTACCDSRADAASAGNFPMPSAKASRWWSPMSTTHHCSVKPPAERS